MYSVPLLVCLVVVVVRALLRLCSRVCVKYVWRQARPHTD